MSSAIVIAALYRFVKLDDFESLRQPLLEIMLENQVRGTLLLAAEGINGTVAGSQAGIGRLLDRLREDERLREFDCKFSYAEDMPFLRSRVKLKREIVTMGVDGIDPANAGTYVEPADWNALIEDPEVTLIDTRNEYEYAIGSFTHAINPHTQSFRDFPAYVENELDPTTHKKVAMFCTGGIRCEKATAYLREKGFDEVYHLQGGILNYLAEVPASESLWHGECFVFDNRVSVNHALERGSYDQCHACRLPITEADKKDSRYRPGVSCPACFDQKSENECARYREREKQVRIAARRGESHMGAAAGVEGKKRKLLKLEAKDKQRQRAGSA